MTELDAMLVELRQRKTFRGMSAPYHGPADAESVRRAYDAWMELKPLVCPPPPTEEQKVEAARREVERKEKERKEKERQEQEDFKTQLRSTHGKPITRIYIGKPSEGWGENSANEPFHIVLSDGTVIYCDNIRVLCAMNRP